MASPVVLRRSSNPANLFVSSYVLSAKRVHDGLLGTLSVCSSRTPGKPPVASPHEVVGLCGQGGRHVFFRVSKTDLLDAVEGIIGLGRGIANGLDKLLGVCRRLRARTIFDTGAGCTNDRAPALVPLLPPEEVWCDGRELPLDVWRLISFEYDLVASGLASQSISPNPWDVNLSYASLSFARLMDNTGRRTVSFDLQEHKVPSVLTTGSTPGPITVSLRRLFWEMGVLLTPIKDHDFTNWYGALRYLHWISTGDSELRVSQKFKADSLDSRYRGIFSEEMGVAMMAVVLMDRYGAKPVVNMVEQLGKRPAGKLADFVALIPGSPDGLIVECKGSLGRKVSAMRFKRALDQVDATHITVAGTTNWHRLAMACSISYSGSSLPTNCYVEDPPGDAAEESLPLERVQLWRQYYAQSLRFVGLESAFRQVLSGRPVASLDVLKPRADENSEQIERLGRRRRIEELYQVDILMEAGNTLVVIDRAARRLLQAGLSEETVLKLEVELRYREGLARERPLSEGSFINPLGVGVIDFAEENGA